MKRTTYTLILKEENGNIVRLGGYDKEYLLETLGNYDYINFILEPSEKLARIGENTIQNMIERW